MNNAGKKVYKAGKEYLQHAAGMHVHFLEVTSLIKNGLRSRMDSQRSGNAIEEESYLTSVYNWFVAKEPEPESQPKLDPSLLQDKQFLRTLREELKLFEACIRIFEQQCIQTIIETQKEVQSQNIDAILGQERLSQHESRLSKG